MTKPKGNDPKPKGKAPIPPKLARRQLGRALGKVAGYGAWLKR